MRHPNPEQILLRIVKLADEVDDLRRVLAAQNEATAALRREWSVWADELVRIHAPANGIDASKWLATLVST